MNPKKLPKDQLFIDYLLYRSHVIGGLLEYQCINTSNLEGELEFVCSLTSTQSFISELIGNKEDLYVTYTVNDLISALKFEYEQKCLTKDNLTWLEDKNSRLIYYAWRLLSYLDNSRGMYLFKPTAEFSRVKISARMANITTQEVTKNEIITLINRLDCSKNHKIKLLGFIKEYSLDSLERQTLINWFKNDCNEKTEWAYLYLKKQTKEYIALSIPGSSQLKNDIVSFFDVLYTFNKDRCLLLIHDMKKAWDTKTYRDKNTGKKRHSIDMSNDIDVLLKEMCVARNEHKNSLIERLIRAEYENFNTVKN